MHRVFTFITIILITTGVSTAYRSRRMPYRNLYGTKNINMSPLQTFAKLTAATGKIFLDVEAYSAAELKDSTPNFNQEYDFIVVGAGTAGATIASRLSEIKDVTVLLIEAGMSESPLMDVPIIAHYLQLNNDINWKYQSEPSDMHCRGMKDKKCNLPRGRVMGGSSVLNYMIATRGSPLDYDNWSKMGNEGWSYKEVLKYFKKLEDIGVPEIMNDTKNHNTDGPVRIEYAPYHTPLAQSFLKSGLEMGYPTVDYNANLDVGFSYIQATVKKGMRMSTNRAYLHNLNYRKNLFVTKNSYVNKVLIDPKRRRAYGVEFTKFNTKINVRARKEVILSAGAIGSPQILMLSGVGPSKHLTDHKIDVIQDAPVGENLMDHIAYGGLVFLVDEPVSLQFQDLSNPMKPYMTDFLLNNTGPFTVTGGCEALAFIDVDKPGDLTAYANVELLFMGGSVVSDSTFRVNFGISDKVWAESFSRINGRHSFSLFPMLLRPKSRGKILLRDRDPRSKPKIFANYLNDPEDVRVMVKGVRAAIAVGQTKAMRKFNSRVFDFTVPGCDNYIFDSDEYWECAIRTFTFTIYHQSGTCKMAPEGDPTGVVNPRLQVKGIKGLRVADASIMPEIMTGHTNVPVIMIGEKLADMVKEDWGYDIN